MRSLSESSPFHALYHALLDMVLKCGVWQRNRIVRYEFHCGRICHWKGPLNPMRGDALDSVYCSNSTSWDFCRQSS